MAEPKAALSLTEFAASLRPAPVCRVCELPELAEIIEARNSGVAYDTIVAWLVDARGYPAGFVSDHRLQRHFKEHRG